MNKQEVKKFVDEIMCCGPAEHKDILFSYSRSEDYVAYLSWGLGSQVFVGDADDMKATVYERAMVQDQRAEGWTLTIFNARTEKEVKWDYTVELIEEF